MRVLALLFIAALAACTPRGGACDISVTRDLQFTQANAEEQVTVSSSGPSCDKAILHYAIRDAEGRPVWAWTAPLERAFGEAIDTSQPAHVREFLERWASPTTLATTSTAPEFSDLVPGQTTLDQLTYEDIRARDLPMLCHLSGTARETCVFWEPAAGGAGHLLDRDIIAEETTE